MLSAKTAAFQSWCEVCTRRGRTSAKAKNRSAELQFGIVWRAPNGPIWKSALQARGSWFHYMREAKEGYP